MTTNYTTQDHTEDNEPIYEKKFVSDKYIKNQIKKTEEINEPIKSEEEVLLIKEGKDYIKEPFNINEEKKTDEVVKKQEEPGIYMDIKAINTSAHINRLKKIYMNKKNYKKNKMRALNQYNPPSNIKFNPNPISYPKFPIPYSHNRNNIINNNPQFMNYKLGQNNQYIKNNNNQLINNNFGINMNNNNNRNNNGFNGNNNFNNFNQGMNNMNNNMNNPNNMQLIQQIFLAMNNMKGNNPSMNNELLMNILNKINQQNNNLQNQNNGLNLNLLPFLVNNNKNNQEEISIIRTIRENTDKGQKIYKVKVSTSMVKNDKKGKFQK